MPSRVLVIGLDAFPASVVDRWRAEGRCSVLGSLAAAAAEYRLDSTVEWLPGAIWPEISTGVSVARSGLFYLPGQLRTGEADARPIEPHELRFASYWHRASDAGRLVAAVDPVEAAPVSPFNGLQLLGWGVHDRRFPTTSSPADLLPELDSRYGPYPVESCDELALGTRASTAHLRDLLVAAADRKTALALDLLARRPWDLFSVTFCEAHCAGHQLWPEAVTGLTRSGRTMRDELARALDAVAMRVDRGVGRLLDAARAETTLIVASHGMGVARRAEHLLPECLDRLGVGAGRRARVRAANLLPAGLRRLGRRLIGTRAIERLQLGVESRIGHFTGGSARAVALHNGATGAIRLSIAGRELAGVLQPGDEVDRVVDMLVHELGELRDGRTRERVVRAVRPTRALLGEGHHADLPDLLVSFQDGTGRVERVVSPRGWAAAQPRAGGRRGEHVPDSRLWLDGRRLASGQRASVLDIAPTVLHLLGVDAAGMDGRALELD